MTYDPLLDGPGRDPDRQGGCLPLLLLLVALLARRSAR